MKIGVDIKSAFEPKRSGIGNYCYNLVRNLLLIDKKNEYYLYYDDRKGKSGFQAKDLNYISRNNPFNFLNRMDVFHGPDFKLLPVRAGKKIVTIHDLACCVPGDFMSVEFKKLTKEKIKKSLKSADTIVTISNAVKEEIKDYFKIEDSRIAVIYHGVNEELQITGKTPEKKNELRKLGISEPYFLFVGNLETRKNIIGLISAFQVFKEKYKTPHQLVLAGKSGYGYESIRMKLDSIKQDSVKETGWVSDNELELLYSNAEAFVFPTFYEGFGMPALEAMRFSLPVLCSNIPVLKEIISDAASYFEADDFGDIASSMYSVINERDKRIRLIENGKRILKNFSWRKTAEEMIKVYER